MSLMTGAWRWTFTIPPHLDKSSVASLVFDGSTMRYMCFSRGDAEELRPPSPPPENHGFTGAPLMVNVSTPVLEKPLLLMPTLLNIEALC